MIPKKTIDELLEGLDYSQIEDLINELPEDDDDTAIITIDGREYALVDGADNLLTSHEAQEIMRNEQDD